MTAPGPADLSDQERAKVYLAMLRGLAQTAQDHLCAQDTRHAWGQWERTAHHHDIPLRFAHGDQMVVRNQTLKISARRKCLNCGNGPGPRVSALRVAQHLKQENAK